MKKHYVVMQNAGRNSVMYKVFCDCGDDEHTLLLDFEVDKERPGLASMTMYGNVGVDSYLGVERTWAHKLWKALYEPVSKRINLNMDAKRFRDRTLFLNFLDDVWDVADDVAETGIDFWCRIKFAAKMLATGSLTASHDIVFVETEHINQILDMFKEAQQHLKWEQ